MACRPCRRSTRAIQAQSVLCISLVLALLLRPGVVEMMVGGLTARVRSPCSLPILFALSSLLTGYSNPDRIVHTRQLVCQILVVFVSPSVLADQGTCFGITYITISPTQSHLTFQSTYQCAIGPSHRSVAVLHA